MREIDIRVSDRAGRITLNRPGALNALTLAMVRDMKTALTRWASDPGVDLVVIDAAGEKAFCAGGDIAGIYRAMRSGDLETPRDFWREEYPLNALLAHYPKPVAAFCQGFTMGGGVGVACHVSHRIVGETSRMAMPECGIGLVPDVGGSLLLARAPGRLGEYLGTTGFRMGPGDAIHAGFADFYIPETEWPALIALLERTGDRSVIAQAARTPPRGTLAGDQTRADALFGGATFREILARLREDGSDWSASALRRLSPNAPLAMAATVELVHRARAEGGIGAALAREFRYGYRIVAQGDFLEGIRAAIIDKDKSPKWAHDAIDAPEPAEVAAMLGCLGEAELVLEDMT